MSSHSDADAVSAFFSGAKKVSGGGGIGGGMPFSFSGSSSSSQGGNDKFSTGFGDIGTLNMGSKITDKTMIVGAAVLSLGIIAYAVVKVAAQ